MPNSNEYMARYMLARYHRRRSEYLETQGNRCALCGSTDRLEIDHRDPRTKSFHIGRAFSGYSEKRLQAELAKCWALCHDCHAKKTAVDQAVKFSRRIRWEHGTLGGYRYCRCQLCKTAKADYAREQRVKTDAQPTDS